MHSVCLPLGLKSLFEPLGARGSETDCPIKVAVCLVLTPIKGYRCRSLKGFEHLPASSVTNEIL